MAKGFTAPRSFAAVVAGELSGDIPATPRALSKSFNEVLGNNGLIKTKSPSTFKGEPAIFFTKEEISSLSSPFRFAIIGKFPHWRPSMDIIRKFFYSLDLISLKSVGLLQDNHVIVFINHPEDYSRLLIKSTWYISGALMKLQKWSPDFFPSYESPMVPVWVGFPGLPIHFFEKSALFNIASIFGMPLKLDEPTANLTRPTVARVCIEVDISKPKKDCFWIGSEKEGFWQEVFFENPPLFCEHCKVLGHEAGLCVVKNPGLKKKNEEGRKDKTARDTQMVPTCLDTTMDALARKEVLQPTFADSEQGKVVEVVNVLGAKEIGEEWTVHRSRKWRNKNFLAAPLTAVTARVVAPVAPPMANQKIDGPPLPGSTPNLLSLTSSSSKDFTYTPFNSKRGSQNNSKGVSDNQPLDMALTSLQPLDGIERENLELNSQQPSANLADDIITIISHDSSEKGVVTVSNATCTDTLLLCGSRDITSRSISQDSFKFKSAVNIGADLNSQPLLFEVGPSSISSNQERNGFDATSPVKIVNLVKNGGSHAGETKGSLVVGPSSFPLFQDQDQRMLAATSPVKISTLVNIGGSDGPRQVETLEGILSNIRDNTKERTVLDATSSVKITNLVNNDGSVKIGNCLVKNGGFTQSEPLISNIASQPFFAMGGSSLDGPKIVGPSPEITKEYLEHGGQTFIDPGPSNLITSKDLGPNYSILGPNSLVLGAENIVGSPNLLLGGLENSFTSISSSNLLVDNKFGPNATLAINSSGQIMGPNPEDDLSQTLFLKGNEVALSLIHIKSPLFSSLKKHGISLSYSLQDGICDFLAIVAPTFYQNNDGREITWNFIQRRLIAHLIESKIKVTKKLRKALQIYFSRITKENQPTCLLENRLSDADVDSSEYSDCS